jgi:predicted AAA+ superfamily ATPase
LNEVHRLIESKGHRFILTGSSARPLRRKGTNLLAGRAFTYYMHPLTVQELGEQFNLSYALTSGMLPKVYHTKHPKEYLESYVKTYVKEEVQQEAVTRNISLFARFLNVASFSQGEVLNYTNIAREIGSNRQTVANFFDILDDLLIALRLPVFARRAKRELVAQLKFYYFDVGVYLALRPKGPLDLVDELDGAALETLFLQQARALNDYNQWGYEFYYWRTRAKQEVDFVLYGAHGLHAFEIKRKQNLSPKDFCGLSLFKQNYPMANCYLLYGGTREYFENDVKVIPFLQAIAELPKILETSRYYK